jgi:hypothetical protein
MLYACGGVNAVYPFQKGLRCSATSKRTRKRCMAPAVKRLEGRSFPWRARWRPIRKAQWHVPARRLYERGDWATMVGG